MKTLPRILLLIILFSVIFSILGSHFLFLTTLELLLFIAFFFRTSRKIITGDDPAKLPFVSILIPMRNEEQNAADCIASLASLQYPHFEIIIGDDASTDETARLLKEAAGALKNKISIKVITIPPIQNGWTGRTWALHQLAKEATGELLLATDADTRHSPESLQHSVSHFLKTKADIMARFPYPIVADAGGWPTLFLFFTLRFSSWFSTSLCGKRQALAKEEYLLYTKKCYTELGGYESFKSDYPTILPLLDAAFKTGKNVIILDDDTMEITAKAYDGFWGTTKGITERINFRYVNFYSFLGMFAALSFSTDGISKIASGFLMGDGHVLLAGLASYFVFATLFGIYLFMSHQSIRSSFFGPILGFHMVLMSLFAVARTAFQVPLHWKGRSVHIR